MVYHDKTSLSQNFIKYPSLVRELLDTADINKDDLVVEIGPGKGIITNQLTKRAKEVIAIEKDESLANELNKNEFNNVKIINKDFLDYPLPNKKYKIFSNIPFSITSEIINKILKSEQMPEAMYLIMQKEGAEKYTGVPMQTLGSLLTLPFFEVKILGEIDRTNFTLKPQVKIVFAEFIKRANFFVKEEDKKMYRHFIEYGFDQWQPTVLDTYKKIFTRTQLMTLKKSLKIGDEKPSELSLDKWLLIFKTFKRIASPEQKEIVQEYSKK